MLFFFFTSTNQRRYAWWRVGAFSLPGLSAARHWLAWLDWRNSKCLREANWLGFGRHAPRLARKYCLKPDVILKFVSACQLPGWSPAGGSGELRHGQAQPASISCRDSFVPASSAVRLVTARTAGTVRRVRWKGDGSRTGKSMQANKATLLLLAWAFPFSGPRGQRGLLWCVHTAALANQAVSERARALNY